MGSATFALPTLVRLFEKGYSIAGVITQPDKPSGRGQVRQGPPVKNKAVDLNLPVYQPASLKDAESHSLIETLNPEMIIVVAYGKILPPWLVNFPKHGSINLHGSLLPKYRGAAPVHWAIANGEAETGVCSMAMNEGLDTGPVYSCERTIIDRNESVQQLYDRLASMGADLMERTINGVVEGKLTGKPQDDSKATFAPMLKKEHGYIDWRLPAIRIHDHVRAFNPWPGTVTRFRGSTYKILKTEPKGVQETIPTQHFRNDGTPGELVVSRHFLAVLCGDATLLEIRMIQPENRKAVSGVDFVNGARILVGEKFETLMDN
jgi:methionyl-tRNA formyltransferase